MKSYKIVQMGNILKSNTLSYLENYKNLKQFSWTTTLECMASAFLQVAGR